MAMLKPAPSHAPLDTDVETTGEDIVLGPEHVQTSRGRSGCRLVAGVAGTLLVVAVMAAAVSSSTKQATSGCEGSSCAAQSDHLDKVLELKQNTMALEDCPPGYYGTIINIKGKGQAWSRGNLTDCAKVCDTRDGCKGFEFHDKNGKCGTYTDGYILGGKQSYRWLTCVKEGTKAATVMFTVKNLDFEDLMANSTAKEGLENAVKEVVALLAGVPSHKVGVDLSQGSVKVVATIAEGGIDKNATQLFEALKEAEEKIPTDILAKLLDVPVLVALKTGDLTVEGVDYKLLENWDPRTTTAPEAGTTSAGER